MRNVIAAFIIMIVAVMTAHTQSALRPRQLVEQAHLEGKSFTPISLFERAINFRSEVEITPIEDYTLLNLDSEGLRQLAAAPPARKFSTIWPVTTCGKAETPAWAMP